MLNYTPALADLILTVLSASDALGSVVGGVFVDLFRGFRRALLVTAI